MEALRLDIFMSIFGGFGSSPRFCCVDLACPKSLKDVRETSAESLGESSENSISCPVNVELALSTYPSH